MLEQSAGVHKSTVMKVKHPNFLIPGAAKCGTTSLFHYLREHPEIYIPERKECRYFSQMPGTFQGPGDEAIVNQTVIKSLPEYEALYADVAGEKAVGDVSPDYMYYHHMSIREITKVLGRDLRILIILRNPIERCYSHYLHYVRDNRETLTFEEALEQEEKRRSDNWEWAWSYKRVSFYYEPVRAYLDTFRSVKVCLFDDLQKDALGLMRGIYEYLRVDPTFRPNVNVRYNALGIPRNWFFKTLMYRKNPIKTLAKSFMDQVLSTDNKRKLLEQVRANTLVKPKMQLETRKQLAKIFEKDILNLQGCIHRDLSHWLNGKEATQNK